MSFDINAAMASLNDRALALSQDTSWIDNYQLPSDIPVPLAPARPNANTTYQTPSISGQPGLTIPGSGISVDTGDNPVTVSTPQGSQSGSSTWGGLLSEPFIANETGILIGLVLIAAAVFSFSRVKDVIVTGVKGAATLAA